jgi:hypothetical protein
LNNDENIILLNTKRLGRCHNYNHSINNNNDNPIPPHFNYEKQLCKDIDLVSETFLLQLFHSAILIGNAIKKLQSLLLLLSYHFDIQRSEEENKQQLKSTTNTVF